MQKILLIEDDNFLGSILKNRLTQIGYEVNLASSLESAQSLLELNSDTKLILLDLILGDGSGFSFLENIKNHPLYSNIPVIILSNLGQTSDIEKGRALGVLDYWIKSDNPINSLLAKISEKLNYQNSLK